MRRNRRDWGLEIAAWIMAAMILTGLVLFARACTRRVLAQGQPPLPPAFYKVFDVGTDFRTLHPEWPPTGSVHWHTWEELHSGPGQFTWAPLENDMQAEAGLFVQAADGSLIPKPVLLEVVNYLSPDGPLGFRDMTPQWVYERMMANGEDVEKCADGQWTGHVLEQDFQEACLPAYDSPTWQLYMREFVLGLGKELMGNPNLAAVIVATGLDAENQPIKAWGGVDWPAVMRLQAPGVENAFGKLVPAMTGWYVGAFPGLAVLLNNATGQGRCAWASQAEALGAGLKNSGMVPDIADHVGYGTYCGAWVPWVSDRPEGTVLVAESKSGLGGVETYVWSLYAALDYGPVAISVHPEYLEQVPSDFLWWVWGRMAEPDASAWTVLRDKEYPLVDWGTGGVSGAVGPWEQNMVPGGYRVETRADLTYGQDAVWARQFGAIREGGGALTFDVRDGMDLGTDPELRLIILGGSGDVLLRYWTKQDELREVSIGKGDNPEGWNEVTVSLPGLWSGRAIDLRALGDAKIHLAEIRADTIPAPTVTPTMPKPTWTPTVLPTATPTATAIAWFQAESSALDDLMARVSTLETRVAVLSGG